MAVTGLDYSIEFVRKYIDKDNRDSVKACLLKAVQRLVEELSAGEITMETVYPNLPENALRKYDEISDVITEFGFSIEKDFQDETNGKYYWLFSKLG